jgi:hypothetical protein
MSSTDPADTTRWTRILHLGGDAWLGLVGEVLFVGDHDSPKREVDRVAPTGLLPCLERPYDVVVAELREREEELALNRGTLIDLVPLDSVLAAAVDSQMDYWIQLALDWLGSMPRAESSEGLLGSISSEAWPTQRARHRARMLLRTRRS